MLRGNCVVGSCGSACADRFASCGTPMGAHAQAALQTPFDDDTAFVFDPGAEWRDRAVCARHGVTAAARAANLTFNGVGVTIDIGAPMHAARALLRTGRTKDCATTEVVTKLITTNVRHAHHSGRQDRWLHHLFVHGYSRIDQSWGLATILRQHSLAKLLKQALDAQDSAHVNEGEEGKHSGVKIVDASGDEKVQLMMRNLTSVLLRRLHPTAAAYLGPDAVSGSVRLVLLEGKTIASLWYPSGMCAAWGDSES